MWKLRFWSSLSIPHFLNSWILNNNIGIGIPSTDIENMPINRKPNIEWLNIEIFLKPLTFYQISTQNRSIIEISNSQSILRVNPSWRAHLPVVDSKKCIRKVFLVVSRIAIRVPLDFSVLGVQNQNWTMLILSIFNCI